MLVWFALVICALIVNLPLIGYVRYLFLARKIEMVITNFQPLLDQLSALIAPVTDLKAKADAGPAVTVQDIQDTVTALQTAVNAVANAAGQATQ